MIYYVSNPQNGVQKEPLEKLFLKSITLSETYGKTIYIYVGKLGMEEKAMTLIFGQDFCKKLKKHRSVSLEGGFTIHLVHPGVISNMQNGVIITLFSQLAEVKDIVNNSRFINCPKVHIPWSKIEEDAYLKLFPKSKEIK